MCVVRNNKLQLSDYCKRFENELAVNATHRGVAWLLVKKQTYSSLA